MNEPQDAPAPGFDPEQPLIGHEMLTSALVMHLERASREDVFWREAPRPHLHLAYQEHFY